jgi:hypothetical protein
MTTNFKPGRESDSKYQEQMKGFLEALGVERAYGMLQLQDGSTVVLDYNANDTDRAGMMYQLKKLVDADLAAKAMRFHQTRAEQKLQNLPPDVPNGTPEESPA